MTSVMYLLNMTSQSSWKMLLLSILHDLLRPVCFPSQLFFDKSSKLDAALAMTFLNEFILKVWYLKQVGWQPLEGSIELYHPALTKAL